MVDYLVIGHLAKDLTTAGPRLGGTAAYASLTAQALGYHPGLVTAYGDDLDLSPIGAVNVTRLPSPASTTFENLYGLNGRIQYLRARATPLNGLSLPAGWPAPRIVHLAPLAREIEPGLAAAFAGMFVGLTPQGWLRAWDGAGLVRHTDWPQALETLGRVSAAVMSIEDIRSDWNVAQRWATATPALVVTEGAHGCTVFVRGRPPRHFPAPNVSVVDPTGAGDIFAATFFIHFYETHDADASAQLACQIASLSVTRVGLDGVPTEAEVTECRDRVAQGRK